jgi:hypothetical protein
VRIDGVGGAALDEALRGVGADGMEGPSGA